jgi:hypothetical protein
MPHVILLDNARPDGLGLRCHSRRSATAPHPRRHGHHRGEEASIEKAFINGCTTAPPISSLELSRSEHP